MKSLLLALAIDAEAGERIKPEVSCATVQQVDGEHIKKQRDQVCLTEASIRAGLDRLLPGQVKRVRDLKEEGGFTPPGAFLVYLNDGRQITTFVEGDEPSSYDCYYKVPNEKSVTSGAIYPTLEELKTPHEYFKPETHEIDLESIWKVEVTLQQPYESGDLTPDRIDFSKSDTLFLKTYYHFLNMVTTLGVSIRVGQEEGWGEMSSVSGMQRFTELGSYLTREKVRKELLNSPDFRKLTPEIQSIFTDYVEGKGPIITALRQTQPIKDKCGGRNPTDAPAPFWQ